MFPVDPKPTNEFYHRIIERYEKAVAIQERVISRLAWLERRSAQDEALLMSLQSTLKQLRTLLAEHSDPANGAPTRRTQEAKPHR